MADSTLSLIKESDFLVVGNEGIYQRTIVDSFGRSVAHGICVLSLMENVILGRGMQSDVFVLQADEDGFVRANIPKGLYRVMHYRSKWASV